MIMRAYTYPKGDLRIHTDHEDDGTFVQATLMTNPPKGFRRRLLYTTSAEEYQSWARLGWILDYEKRL
jgi:hypothetical protein